MDRESWEVMASSQGRACRSPSSPRSSPLLQQPHCGGEGEPQAPEAPSRGRGWELWSGLWREEKHLLMSVGRSLGGEEEERPSPFPPRIVAPEGALEPLAQLP